MEIPKELEQLTKNFENYSRQNTELIPENSNDLSVYKGPLEGRVILSMVAQIKKAFPSLPITFFDTFDDRIRANNFSNQRLMDAVAYVIDNCVYPQPTIAHFISFDRKVKAYSYDEICNLITNHEAKMADYKAITRKSRLKPVFIHINDIVKFNITNEK